MAEQLIVRVKMASIHPGPLLRILSNYLVVAIKFISVVVFDVVTCRNYQIMFKALTFNDTIPLLAELICMPLDVFIDEILPRS